MSSEAIEVTTGLSLRRPGRWEALALLVLLLAAGVRETRPLALLVLGAGFVLAARRGDGTAWTWGAVLPVATSLTWGLLPAPIAPPGAVACADPLSPPALWRFAEAVLVLAVLGIAARRLRADRASLSLRLPGVRVAALAAVTALAVGPLALLVAEPLARPFFGEFHLQLGAIGALAPALLFALSNATMEELAYRGALQRWGARALGATGALLFQALVFGFAHSGPDFVASPLPVLLTVTAGGLAAGLIVRRTGSLLLPIALHTAFDIPIYFYFACRIT